MKKTILGLAVALGLCGWNGLLPHTEDVDKNPVVCEFENCMLQEEHVHTVCPVAGCMRTEEHRHSNEECLEREYTNGHHNNRHMSGCNNRHH